MSSLESEKETKLVFDVVDEIGPPDELLIVLNVQGEGL